MPSSNITDTEIRTQAARLDIRWAAPLGSAPNETGEPLAARDAGNKTRNEPGDFLEVSIIGDG